jgi:hypothetical protein
MIAAVMVTAVGLSALLAWPAAGQQAGPGPVATGTPRPAASNDGGVTQPGAPSASPLASSSAPPVRDGPILIGGGVARQAGAGRVAAFLGAYFAAVNHRDYQAYVGLFDGPARPDRNEQQFLDGYRTTIDTDPVLVDLDPTATGEWAATVTFTSHQSPSDSATHSSCTDWEITLFLQTSGGSYLIELPPAGYDASRVAC